MLYHSRNHLHAETLRQLYIRKTPYLLFYAFHEKSRKSMKKPSALLARVLSETV